MIHRDLKPLNIIVSESKESSASSSKLAGLPQVKILDFGLARITDTDVQAATMLTEVGMIKGTPPYMSPEQARGEALLRNESAGADRQRKSVERVVRLYEAWDREESAENWRKRLE